MFLSSPCPLLALSQSTNDLTKLNPPYGELPPTFWEQHGTTVVLGSVALVAVIAALVWLALHPKPVPPVPPEVLARRELEALQGRREDGALLSEVSQVLCRYMIAAFSLPAGEFTTTEFCRVIAGNESLGHDLAGDLARFLQTCDVKKFAATAPPEPLNALARARDLFDRAELRRRELAAKTEVKQ